MPLFAGPSHGSWLFRDHKHLLNKVGSKGKEEQASALTSWGTSGGWVAVPSGCQASFCKTGKLGALPLGNILKSRPGYASRV